MPDRRLLQNLALSRNVIVHDKKTISNLQAENLTLAVWSGNLPVEISETGINLKFLQSLENSEGIEIFVGEFKGKKYSIKILDEQVAEIESWKNLREIGAALDDLEVGIATTAAALSIWHQKSRYCPECGEQTMVDASGWSRICPNQHQSFPRTDPAVICLVNDAEDKALLARRIDWQEGWMSTLAGFVEAGESAESALAREIKEESGIDIDPESIEYLGSQPWPFPNSLMLGYRAQAKNFEINVDGEEIVEAQWFSKEEFKTACESGTLKLPPPISIASRLIEDWYGSRLQAEWFRN
jgi:NAD+ diphosphatase